MADYNGFKPVSTVLRLFLLNILSGNDFVVIIFHQGLNTNTNCFSSQTTSYVVNAFNMISNEPKHEPHNCYKITINLEKFYIYQLT